MIEVWKDIEQFEGLYKISNLERVKSLPRNIGKRGGFDEERILTPYPDSSGYYMIGLSKEGTRKMLKVHRILAKCFIGGIPDGYVVDHKNNIKTDNRLENLQIITHRENCSKDSKRGSSKFVGVYYHKSANKWLAQIQINGEYNYLGLFDNEQDASEAYQNKLREIQNENT